MGRVRSKKVSENNVLIKIKIIKYKMTMSKLLLLFLHIHIAICVPSLVEIAPGVPELCSNIHTSIFI
jgi:hypothetical protein